MEDEIKRLEIPEGWEFDKLGNGVVILKKKELVLPETFEECNKGIGMSYFPSMNWYVPNENENALRALCKLLICRNAWWKQIGWNPDWEDNQAYKNVIYVTKGKITAGHKTSQQCILAFPTPEICEKFYNTFRDFIWEAKELL